MTKKLTVRDRAANQAARAIVRVVEEQSGQDMDFGVSMGLKECIHDLLGSSPIEVRKILEQPFDPALEADPQGDLMDDLYGLLCRVKSSRVGHCGSFTIYSPQLPTKEVDAAFTKLHDHLFELEKEPSE